MEVDVHFENGPSGYGVRVYGGSPYFWNRVRFVEAWWWWEVGCGADDLRWWEILMKLQCCIYVFSCHMMFTHCCYLNGKAFMEKVQMTV
jgi:hypothetical protein